MMEQRNLIGNRYGHLTVIEMLGAININSGHYYSRVICDCGNKEDVRDSILINGRKIKCKECYLKERGRHHMTGTAIHNKWLNMRQRCNNPNDSFYKDYGGRGIKVCNEWDTSFENFYEWALNNGYEEGLTIDRIDVNGNYEPSNCRFITMAEQATNKRNNVYVELEGGKVTISEAARLTGIKVGTLGYRLRKGWDKNKAVHSDLCKGYGVFVKDIHSNEFRLFNSLAEASLFIGKNRGFLSNKSKRNQSNTFQIGDYYVEIAK